MAGDAGAGASVHLLRVTESQLWAANGLGPALHDPHGWRRLQGEETRNTKLHTFNSADFNLCTSSKKVHYLRKVGRVVLGSIPDWIRAKNK